jgi:hypothetical protein
MLDGLPVAPSGSMAGYSREEFPHWASEAERYGWKEPDGSCDVRDAALIRDGEGVEIDEDCSITAGSWLDPYTGRTLTDSSEVDIDQVVPLEECRCGQPCRILHLLLYKCTRPLG